MAISIAWGQKAGTTLVDECIRVCKSLCWLPTYQESVSDLLTCIAFETGHSFRSDIVNAAGSGAVGLIQFLPATAKKMGTTVDALRGMNIQSQMDYVGQYFTPYRNRIKNLHDMYMGIFYPKGIGKDDSFVVFKEGGKGYLENAGFDTSHTGTITRADICIRIDHTRERGKKFAITRESLD